MNRRTLVIGHVSLCGLCRATKVSFFPAARYLHSTFSPDAVEVNMVDGRASCSTLTYGDFTVGAWLPQSGTTLELDLSEIDDAPWTIRER